MKRSWLLWLVFFVFFGAVAGLLHYGAKRYAQGVDDEKNRHLSRWVESAKMRQTVEQGVERLSDGDAFDELLGSWGRD